MNKKINIRSVDGNVHVMAIQVDWGLYVHHTLNDKGWTISVGKPPCFAFYRHIINKEEAIKIAKLLSALFDFSEVSKVEDIPEEIRGHLLLIRDLLTYKYD